MALPLGLALKLGLNKITEIVKNATVGGVKLGMNTVTQGGDLKAAGTAITHGFEGWVQHGIGKALGEVEGMLGGMVDIGAQDFTPYGSIKYWNDIISLARDMNRSLGIAGELGRNIQRSFVDSLPVLAELGVEAEKMVADYANFIEKIGRNLELTSDEIERFAEIRAVFGQDASEIFAYFDNLGVSIADSSKGLKKLLKDSQSIGLNSRKVLSELTKNLRYIDRLSFKEGRKGLEEMAKMAVKTKLTMSEVAKFSEGILDGGIEGAIEMGANLQILGGEIAAMGDPFELFYLARNAPEEFAERIQDATKGVAQFNDATGEIDIDPLGMSRLREMSKYVNIDLEELSRTAKAIAKESEIEGMFDASMRQLPEFEQMLTKVAGAASFDTGLNQWVVTIDGAKKSIQELSEQDIGELGALDVDVSAEDSMMSIVKSNESLNEVLDRLIKQLKLTAISPETYFVTEDFVKPFADAVRISTLPWAEAFNNLGDNAAANFEEFLEAGLTDGIGGILEEGFNNVTGTLQGIYGTLLGIYNERAPMFAPSLPTLGTTGDEFGDAFTRVNDGVIFNPRDELLTVASTQKGQLTQAVDTMMNTNGGGGSANGGGTATFNVTWISPDGTSNTRILTKDDVKNIIFDASQGNSLSGGASTSPSPY